MNGFLPSAVKFHYQFNLRELSAITQVGRLIFACCIIAVCCLPAGACHIILCLTSAQSKHDAQGLCRMVPEQFKEKAAVVRLWVHECERVLCDRLVSDADIAKFGDFRVNTTKKYFEDVQLVSCSD